MNTPNACSRIIFINIVLLLTVFCANAQQTQLLDNFNRSDNAVVGTPVLGPPAWTEVETGSTATTGASIDDNDDDFLRLTTTSTPSREYVYRDCSGNYNTVFSANPSQLVWEFKFRQTVSDPSGFANNAYGMALILGSTTSGFHNSGNGYAVVLGTPSTNTDPIRLVRFTGGFSTDANLTTLISYSDFSTHYLAIRVTYTPSTNLWELWVDSEDDDDNDFGDVSYNNTVLRGTATDATYTGSDLRYLGALYNHPNSTGGNHAEIDEIYIPLIIIPTYYYSKATGFLNDVATWGTNLDGSGPNPPNFTTAGQFFNIRNNPAPTINGAWTVSGATSRVTLGDTVNNIVFTVPPTFAFVGPIDVAANSTLVLEHATVPAIGVVGIPSVVNYASALTQTIRPIYYWDLICTSTGGRTWASGTTGILDTFIVGANAFNNGNGTVDFAGSHTQYVPAIKYENIINTGGGDRILAPSGTIEIGGVMTPSIGTYTVTGSTVLYSDGGNATFPVLYVGGSGPNYHNLTFTGNGDHIQEGPLIVGGNLTITNGDYFQNTNTSIFTLTVNGDLILNGGELIFSDGTGANVLTLKGNLTQTSGMARVEGSVLGRITFAGTGIQTISAADSIRFQSCIFTINSGAHVKLNQNLGLLRSAAIPTSLKGQMNVLSGGTLDCSTFRISSAVGASGNSIFNLAAGATLISANVNGVYAPNGSVSSINMVATFNSGANYVFNSGAPQVPGLNNTTMNNLTIDNTSNVTLQSNINVNGLMTFLNGRFNTTDSYKIILGANGSVTGAGANKYVNGNFEKFILAGTTGKTFEIGDANSYNPVDLVFPPASNGTGSIHARVYTGDHPSMPGSGLDPLKTVNKYWTLTNNGVDDITPYSADFHFVNPTDMDPLTNALNFVVRNYSGSSWHALGAGTAASDQTGATSINAFGDFQIGERFPPPTVTCPVLSPVPVISGCSAIVNFAPTFTGNPTPVITYSQDPGTFFPVGTTPVIITATNINAIVTCTLDVVVTDGINPQIQNCPTDVFTFADFGVCETSVSWTEPTTTDNCSAVIVGSHAPGAMFPVGITTVTYVATDASGNTAACSFNVEVVDGEFPVLADCPFDINVETNGSCGLNVNWTAPTATDNCSATVTSNYSPGDFIPAGINTITYVATDPSGNSTSCSFTITVSDVQTPVITCPADIHQNTDPDVCGAIVNFTVGATDNCPVTAISTPASGSLFPVGTTVVNSVVTDDAGNSANCSFNVVITDNQNPSIVCPANMIVGTEPNACAATVNFTVGYSDNCNVTLVSTPASGSVFPAGTTTVVSVATDSSGNTSTCSFDITVVNETEFDTVSCDIFYFPWGGTTTVSGDFSHIYIANSGCDSVVTAHVTINYVDDHSVCTIDACNTLDGTVSHTPVDVDDNNVCTTDGCDSVTGPYHNANPIEDDFNVCTEDGCNSITGPTHTPVNIDDNNVCTTDDCHSITGISHTYYNISDNDSCTVDACHSITGVSHEPVDKNDNNACTIDGCDPDFGIFHVPVDPDDGNPCTVDGCDTSTGVFTHDPVNVDDFDLCTDDGCDSVTGIFHNPVDRDDENACTIDICDPFLGVFNVPIDPDDANACTTDGCDTVTGTFHNPVDVDDNNVCTTDGCDIVTGPYHNPVDIDDNNVCTIDACDSVTGPYYTPVSIDDGNVCTIDACDSVTGVSHTPVNIDDNNVCTTDACDSVTGPYYTLINIDDNNACTIDACDSVSGVSNTPVNTDDGDLCTTDACDTVTGTITHTPVNTDDGNACTTDACDSVTGVSHTPVNINDNDACTDDACDTITGISHTPVDRNDHDECTLDGCDIDFGVFHVPVNTDDGNPCTVDACDSVTGVSHTPVNTDDGNVCTTDACDSSTGNISHTPIDTDDGNPCTVDACDSVTGVSHTPVNTDDGDACTTDACDTVTGTISHTPVNTDDGNACTTDACDSVTGVSHTPVNIDDGDACTDDACDTSTGTISHTPVDYDDGNVCTIDACHSSTGISHTPVTGDDGNACTTDGCDTVTGVFNNPVNTDDGNACTTDACDSITGVSHTPVDTDDGNVCTTDGCDSITGVYHTPVDTDDNNDCTTDACDSVTGVSHTPVDTDDGNVCTTDGCDSVTGVYHTPVDTDDGNVCTTDACDSVTGVTHTPVDTDDGNVCTNDGCDSVTGVYHTPVDTDDGNVCTTDACDSVTGISHTPVSITDGNDCTIDACDSITGVSHALVDVDDGNACTTDGCDSEDGIYHDPVITDDGNVCTTDACDTVTGVSHTPVNTDDGDVCTIDACDSITGVTHIPVDTDDGNACTTDACDSVTGVSHTAVTIDDGNDCTIDACDSITGVSHTLVDVDDGNVCTTDGCDSLDGIYHDPVNVDDGNSCTVDGCDSVTGIFHNNTCGVTLNSKVFTQGFYSGAGLMELAGDGYLFITGVSTDPTDVDTIVFYALEPTFPYNEVDHNWAILKTNGDVSITFGASVIAGNSYYIKVKHKHCVETWSAAPVLFSSVTTYSFTSAATQAFGSNMIETFDNQGWAIYSGDINQDGQIDGSDFLELEPSIFNGDGGYLVVDVNGDGQVDGSDFLVIEPNIFNGVGVSLP